MYPRIFMTKRMDIKARAKLNTIIQHLAHTPDTPQFPTLSVTLSTPHVYVLMHRSAQVSIGTRGRACGRARTAIPVQSATIDKTCALHTYCCAMHTYCCALHTYCCTMRTYCCDLHTYCCALHPSCKTLVTTHKTLFVRIVVRQ